MVRSGAKTYILYKATFPNGKVYIGITGQELKKRIKQHTNIKGKKVKNLPMYDALRHPKNLNKVIWEIVATYTNVENLKNAEIDTIKKYNSTDRKYGYNLSPGGCIPEKGRKYKISAKIIDNSGNIFEGYQEAMNYYGFTRAQIRSSITQKCYCSVWVYFSIHKEGMICAEPRICGNKYRRKIFDHINQTVFMSVTDACTFHGITQADLASMCRRKNNPKFSYLEEVF